MSQGFERLPTTDLDGTRYYDPHSRDVTDEPLSYDQFRQRRMTDESSKASLLNDNMNAQARIDEKELDSAPLGKKIKENSTLFWWMLGLAIVFLYSGYDSIVLSTLNSVDAYRKDWGEWILNDDINPDKRVEDWTIPAKWLSLWDAIGPLGQIAGTALGGWLMDRTGRRFCLMVGSTIGGIAILELFLSNRPSDKEWRRIMLLIGKVVQGFGLGILKIATMAYMSEVTPATLKGTVMSFIPFFTLVGQLTGAAVNFGVNKNKTSLSYLISLGSQWAVAIPPLILALLLPESPAYLLLKNRKSNALASFGKLLGPKHDANAAVNNMERTMEEEARNAVKVSYWDCFRRANIRRTLIVMFAGCIEFLFGLPLLSSVTTFLQTMGISSDKSILFMIGGIVLGTLANLGSSWTINHFGRRQLTYTTLFIASGLWGLMGFAGIKRYDWTGWLSGGLCTAIIMICGLGCWPAAYAIQGETSSLRLRSKTLSLGTLMNNLTNIVANYMMPQLYGPDAFDLGAKTGFVIAAFSLIGAIFTYLFVPELKGRSPMEIEHFFEKGVRSIGSTTWRDTQEEIPLGDA